MKKNYLTIAALFLCTLTFSQINTPPLSPTFELKGTIGFAEVKVVYSRPSARGRKVAGNLIPYNEVWRTGANASTKISFSEDVKLEGNPVPAGEYALYSIFREDTATIILSKNLSWWGALGYDPTEDLLRFEVPVKHPSSHYETFTISFSDFTRNSANFNMKWEHTKAMFSIETEVDAKVMADIQTQVIEGSNANARTYYQAAAYYYETERDAAKALEWINKSIENRENAQYWVIHLQAKILARLGKKEEAISAAKQSMEMAKAGGNPDYVRLNEQLIDSLN